MFLSPYVIIRVFVVALLWQQRLPKVLAGGGDATTITSTRTADSSSSFLFDNDIKDDERQQSSTTSSAAPPLNDNICNAQLIAEFPSATAYSNIMATGEENEISPGTGSDSTFGCMSQDGWCDDDNNDANAIQSSVWFKFVSFDYGYMDISIDQPLDDMQLALWKYIGLDDDDNDDDNDDEPGVIEEDCLSPEHIWSKFELIAANDDSSEGVYPLITNAIIELGQLYFIQLDGYAGETSSGYLLIDFDVLDDNDDESSNIVLPPSTIPIIETDDLLPPANDDICNAQYIDTIPSVIEYDNTMATSETNEIHPGDSSSGSCYAQDGWCFGDEIQSSVWFKFWSVEDGNIDIILVEDDTSNFNGDMQLALWMFGDEGENYICDNDWSLFQLIAANEDYSAGSSNFMPTISYAPIVGNTMYYIQIDGYLGDESMGNMTIEFYPSSTNDDGDDDESPPITDDDTPPSSPGFVGINPFIHDNICNAFDLSIPSVTNYGCHIDDGADGAINTDTASWWLCSNNDYHYNIDNDDGDSEQMLIWFTFVAPNSGNIDIIIDDDTTAGNFFKLTLWKYTGTAYLEDTHDGNNGIHLEACLDSATTATDLDWSNDMDVVAVNSRNGAHGFHPYIRNVNIEPNQLYYMKLDGGLYHHGGSNLSTGGQLEIKYSSSSSSTDNSEPTTSSSSTDSDGEEASSGDEMTDVDDEAVATDYGAYGISSAGGATILFSLAAATSSAVLSMIFM